jgi:hypothetical protein
MPIKKISLTFLAQNLPKYIFYDSYLNIKAKKKNLNRSSYKLTLEQGHVSFVGLPLTNYVRNKHLTWTRRGYDRIMHRHYH